MDTTRLIIFVVLSFAILFGWQKWQQVQYPPQPTNQTAPLESSAIDLPAKMPTTLAHGDRIRVTTDLFDAEIDTLGGDLRKVTLLAYTQRNATHKHFDLLQDNDKHIYVAQTGLLSPQKAHLPTHRSLFSSAQHKYHLDEGQNTLTVRLESPVVDQVKVIKTYTFRRNSYVIDVGYTIINESEQALPLTAYYRFLRDSKTLDTPSAWEMSPFTGPAVYTDEKKFQKVNFEDLVKAKADYPRDVNNGWVAMLQHYFVSAWLLSPKHADSVCATKQCRFELKAVGDDLYSAGVIVKIPDIAAKQSVSLMVPLFAGPEQTKALENAAVGLDLVKDYGWVTIIAKPLFWLLDLIHRVVGNWGWAIVLLTVLIKIAFYPLSAASYRSIAKMKKLTPRMQRLKELYADDRMKFQQAVMEMYKSEKVNPLGGCLPMLVQFPVFIALYYTLYAAVEMREAPWILWIKDLSIADPFFVLPVVMAISMYAQTFLNPAQTDPIQDKIMKIMPLAFSIMFFFLPAGLVLYWVVNNILSIAQQWYITRRIEQHSG